MRTLLLPMIIALSCALALGCRTRPQHQSAYIDDANSALEAGQLEAADAMADLALESVPEDPAERRRLADLLRRKGGAEREAGQLEQAFESFRRAADLEPRRAQKAADLLVALELSQDVGAEPDTVIELAQKAVATDPSSLEARRTVARLLDDAGDAEGAIEHFLWVWEAEPSDTAWGLRLGRLYLMTKQFDDAQAVFSRIAKADEKNVQAWLGQAEAYEGMNHDAMALRIFERLVREYPDNPSILFRFADFLDRVGSTERAAEYRARARGELPGVDRREMRRLR